VTADRDALMSVWRRIVSVDPDRDPMDAVLEELAEYFAIDVEEARRRTIDWETESVEQWHSADRSDEAAVTEFFRSQTSWIFDTMRYHAEQCVGDAFPQSVEVAAALPISPPGRHLDFGAGPGTSSLFFHALGWEITVADISKSFLEFARWRIGRRGIDAKFIDTGLEQLPPDTFDLVTAFDVIAHVPDATTTLRNVRASMRRGGVLVFNIDDRPRTHTTEYHFYEHHYPVLRELRALGFTSLGRIRPFYVYRRCERGAAARLAVRLVDMLRYNAVVSGAGRTARKIVHKLRG
jgi:2-polyprenyl-3-methyl-5-hydroxy-6-metoxy-1,4-benzoquinol methylase